MLQTSHIQKVLFAAFLVMAVQVAVASFSLSGLSDERNKNNKYSLKNLSSSSHKMLSIYTLKSELQFRGSTAISSKTVSNNNTMEANSMMQFDRGNTTYIFPYKFKIKLPKDKLRIPLR